MDNALISIMGMNMSLFAIEKPVELITGGRFYKEDGRYVVVYSESELTGMTGTTTTFAIEPERVTMTRDGDVMTHMVFEKNRKHLSLMDTPFGAMTVGVCAVKMTDAMRDDGGTFSIIYDVELDHEKAGTNSIVVNVKGAVS